MIPSILIALEFDVFRVKEILNSISNMLSFLEGFSLKVNGITFEEENTIYRLICCNPGISLDLGLQKGGNKSWNSKRQCLRFQCMEKKRKLENLKEILQHKYLST